MALGEIDSVPAQLPRRVLQDFHYIKLWGGGERPILHESLYNVNWALYSWRNIHRFPGIDILLIKQHYANHAGLPPESTLLVEIEFSKMENLVVSCEGRSGGKVGEFEFKWVRREEERLRMTMFLRGRGSLFQLSIDFHL